MGVEIVYNNYWRKSSAGTPPSSQHPQFPLTDSAIDTYRQSWRTRFGTGSGNGTIVITTANRYIDFDEGGAELSAVVAVGTYNGQTLAVNMEYWMNAAGALTYTVTYDESTGLFTIAASGTFRLRWNTGSHKSTSVATTIGFLDTADDSGAVTYTADYRRIHYPTEDSGWRDAGAAVEIDYLALLDHNLGSTATITLYGADDTSGTNQQSATITWTAGSIFHKLTTSITKRYWKIVIADPTNAAGYTEITTIVLGKTATLSRPFGAQYEHGPDDFSTAELSDSIVTFGEDRPAPDAWVLPFTGIDDASADTARALIVECQKVHGFIVCLDSTAPATNTYFVLNTAISRPARKHTNYWLWALAIREVL